MKKIRILGTRGIPAAHGGFETFAEHLAIYLVDKGWDVTVYCQTDGRGVITEDVWRGVRRVIIPVATTGAAGTIVFDWLSTLHAVKQKGLILTLGYNTAVFCVLYRLQGIKNIINMDGIEWRRQKWGVPSKLWFWLNDWLGCWLGNHLVADHPEIKRHLATRTKHEKISMIPYGSDYVEAADVGLLQPYDVRPRQYAVLIARAEPENSVLEVVRAWSRKQRNCKLLILGNYDSQHPYQRSVMAAAAGEVIFVGAVYDKAIVQALRYYALFYVHGHQVGGTNPSLVESLGAGNAVIAHDNPYNRWVAENAALYFQDEAGCAALLDQVFAEPQLLVSMANASRARHRVVFTWQDVLQKYENLLADWQQ